jgi:hypothetical protein
VACVLLKCLPDAASAVAGQDIEYREQDPRSDVDVVSHDQIV